MQTLNILSKLYTNGTMLLRCMSLLVPVSKLSVIDLFFTPGLLQMPHVQKQTVKHCKVRAKIQATILLQKFKIPLSSLYMSSFNFYRANQPKQLYDPSAEPSI